MYGEARRRYRPSPTGTGSTPATARGTRPRPGRPREAECARGTACTVRSGPEMAGYARRRSTPRRHRPYRCGGRRMRCAVGASTRGPPAPAAIGAGPRARDRAAGPANRGIVTLTT